MEDLFLLQDMSSLIKALFTLKSQTKHISDNYVSLAVDIWITQKFSTRLAIMYNAAGGNWSNIV